MKTQKILLGLYLLSFCWLPVLSAQFNTFCKYREGEKTYLLRGKVTAPSGLNLRASDNLQADVVAKLPYGAVLKVCERWSEEEIDGKNDYWYNVWYGDKSGFVFGAYLELEKLPEMNFLFPPFGSAYYEIDSFPFEDPWMALVATERYHLDNPDDWMRAYKLRRVSELGVLPPLDHLQPDSIIGYVNGTPFREGRVWGTLTSRKEMLPGMEILIRLGQSRYSIFCTGTVVENADPYYPNHFSHVENYGLFVKKGDQIQQLVGPLHYFLRGDKTTLEMEWVGDLDGDGALDVVLYFCNHHACWSHLVFLSSFAMEEELMHLVDVDSKCGD